MNGKLKQHYLTIIRMYAQYQNLNIQNDPNLQRQYNLVGAGLLNYLPSINFKSHAQIFRNILFHQKLSLLEQGLPELLNKVQFQNLDSSIKFLKNSPSIICTFHLGSYRLINLVLAKHKIPFTLVVAKSVIEKQGECFQLGFNRTNGDKVACLELIDAEHPASALQMVKALKRGNSLVVYLDGNTGSGKQGHLNENCSEIQFLSQKLLVRKGVGYLSHAAKVPVLPVICYRTSLTEIVIKFFDPIFPDLGMDRKGFAERLIQRIYNLAGPYIERFPEQWEAWLYLYKTIVLQQVNTEPLHQLQHPGKTLIFNNKWFGLYQFKSQKYLFDKHDFLSYEIQTPLYGLLSKMQNRRVKTESIDVILLQDLYRKGVLIAS